MGDSHTLGDRPRERFARWFASPASVLVILPVLVVGIGIVVLLLGRKATHDSAETMARHQMLAQADQVQRDVDRTLDQAEPLFAGLRLLADSTLATPDAMQRLHDLVVGRTGIANVSIAFPIGAIWGTYVDHGGTGELRSQESHVGDQTTERTNYGFQGGLHVVNTETSTYDPRTRPHYTRPVEEKHRVWLPPRTFSTSGKTGLTVTEPVYAADKTTLVAVLTIDFDVEGLSQSLSPPPIDGARTVMFVPDGTILAYPGARIPEAATQQKRLLRYTDFSDPALDAMFAAIGPRPEQRFMRVQGRDGSYLVSIAAVGGARAGTAAPIDWFLATLVPEKTLFGASKQLGRDAIIASAAALLIALGVAVMFAWNLVRMRRVVVAARAEAKVARERAKELGSYRLVSRLGAGGMGEVWRAEHQLLARQAAIKLVRSDVLSADPAHAALVQERFRREAQTLASLRSRHTIELYDYGVTDDGSFFFVMELLEGLDMSQLVREHGPQPAARVISLLQQACQSLAEAHDAGLLHRDIKPANLFVCRAADEVDIVKLLDFGIVHNVADPIAPGASAPTGAPAKPGITGTGERLTVEGSVIGTPGYIPPEAATGVSLDTRGDLYSLGCVAWWLLTGAEVYPDVHGDDLIRTHVTEPLPRLRDRVRGWLPLELEGLVVQCLEKYPSARPTDARALAAALAEIKIPEEHQWTRAKAVEWWKSLRATATSTPDAATAAAGAAVLPPQQPATVVAKATPGAAPPSLVVVPKREPTEVMTIEARPSGRIS